MVLGPHGRRASLLAAFLVAALPVAFFHRVLSPDVSLLPSAWLFHDSFFRSAAPEGFMRPPYHDPSPAILNYPYDLFSARTLREGRLPLWNPWNGCGSPLLAHFQSSPFFPLKLIFYASPHENAYDLFLLSRLVAAALGAFLLTRRLGLGILGAGFTAATYSLGGYCVAFVAMSLVSSAAMLPWVLWALDRVLDRPTGRSVALLAVALGLLGVSGHPESNFLVGIVMLFHALGRAAAFRARPGRLCGALAVAAVLGLGLNLHGVLPFAELLREGVTYKHSEEKKELYRNVQGDREASYAPAAILAPRLLAHRPDLIPLDTPRFYANSLGLVALTLAFFALLSRRSDPRAWLPLLAGLGLAYRVPGLNLLYWLPGLNHVYPAYSLLLVAWSVAWLAGQGLDHLARASRTEVLRVVSLSGLVLAGLGGALLFAMVEVGVTGQPDWRALLTTRATRPGELFDGLFAACALPFVCIAAALSPPAWRARVLFAFGIAELLWSGAPLTRGTPAFDFPETEAVRRVRELAAGARVLGLPGAHHTPNVGTATRIADLRLTEAVFPRRYDRFMKTLDPALRSVFPTYQYASRTDSPLLDVAGVRYLVTGRRPSTFLENLYNEDPLEPPPPLLDDDPDRPLTLALDDALVYENRRSLSRAWFVTEVTPARDEDEAERLLGQARSSRELGARPVVEGAACSGVAGPPVPVRVEDPHNDEVRVAVHAPAAGWLILADTWYPGWEARDAAGTVLAIHPANLAFRAVPLPAGDHRIEFRYRPGSFRLGLLLGAASLAAILLLLWRDR